ncbi:MAG: hypothetical protein ACK4M0_02880 [Phreatobacter sp.]
MTRQGRIRAWRAAGCAGQGGATARAMAKALFKDPGPAERAALAARLRRERLGAARGSGYCLERHLALVRLLAGHRQGASRGTIRGRSSQNETG